MATTMTTAGKVGRVIIVAAAMVGSSSVAVSAASRMDPMRCEALKLRCQSRYHLCLARCDRIADRRAIRSTDGAKEFRTNCSDTCDLRHDRTMLRVQQRPVCSDPPPDPNPQACAANLLWLKANYVQCMGRCHARFDRRPEFDCDGCVSKCYDEYRADDKNARSGGVCGEGAAEPVPVETEPEACTSPN